MGCFKKKVQDSRNRNLEMAPGLNGRQTGTVPKNKSKNSGSQSHRLSREFFNQLSMLDLEPMSDLSNKSRTRNRSSTTHSETEAESIRHELGASRSSVVTSQFENGEGCSQESLANKMNIGERKQVVSKLSQIQNYVQQTAALMSALKVSESPAQRAQYEKLSLTLEDLKDSESKLSGLLNKMDSAESRIDSLISNAEGLQEHNNEGMEEEELARRQEESKKKLETLQKRKQNLLKLQEKAKKQLEEAQIEQTRLVARATSLNHELNSNKISDLNVQNLSQRLKAVQQLYNTRNQINDSLGNRRRDRHEVEHLDEDQIETSDTETDFQLVSDKMDELNAMKAQLGQIQKLMASINGDQTVEMPQSPRESNDETKGQTNQSSQNSSFNDCDQNEDGNNNAMKLEQAKSKLNHLTQLLEIVQTAQTTPGLSSSYVQLVSNLVNEEAGSSSPISSPVESAKSPQKNGEGITVETMQVMTKELEETTAAMKEERDKLLAARQELQDLAKRLPLNKLDMESLSPDDCSESEPPILKPMFLETNSRDVLNGSVLTEADQSVDCTERSLYLSRSNPSRIRQRGALNASAINFSAQERGRKNEFLSRNSNHSSRGASRSTGRDPQILERESSPSPSVSCSNLERQNPAIQTQNQLQMSSNLCELMWADSLQRGIRPDEISLQEMFAQHQLLTRTVAQCSQLLWLQQKQIIELRNAMMLQCGTLPTFQHQQITSSQPSVSAPVTTNPICSVLSNSPIFPNVNQVVPATFHHHHHQNFQPVNQNSKVNAGENQNVQPPLQEFPTHFLHRGNQSSMHMSPEVLGYDMRSGNLNRFNPSTTNGNLNSNQNLSSGTNNRVPGGVGCLGPEDSGALNNQVPPGNRANNYWDNFRSYSRQNLLSNTKSNEDTDTSRRCLGSTTSDRQPRDAFISPLSQNNQSGSNTSQQASGNCEPVTVDQYLLPPSQNTRVNQHFQITRSRSVEPYNHRNPGKNESRLQENDSRNVNMSDKNDCLGGARSRNPDAGSHNIRSVRNDVNQSLNLNNTRNFVQMVRDFENEEVPQGNNKKRLERPRCRNDGSGVLNNRGYNTSLWENISSEVSSFIRANDVRPHFLLQLFRDLQQVTTDNLRQRTLEYIQETVSANNLNERTSSIGGGNINIIENRNNIRGNRSNLNRNQSEDPSRIDELFYHLRENQNTIRQNIGMSSYNLSGNNLENPNISNIRDLGNSRNNLETEGLRDLRTYFEANLCNFGHNSALGNPNLSNIKENLTRRGPGTFDVENLQPKNVYLSIYDNASVELRRRNQEHEFDSTFRNYEVGNDYAPNDISGSVESVRASNNQYDLGSSFEGAVGGRPHFLDESRLAEERFSILDSGDNFGRSRQFLTSGNDSRIDINFNGEERKRAFVEEDGGGTDRTLKFKKNGSNDVEGAGALVGPQWERNSARDTSFDSSSLSLTRNDMTSPFIPICDNSFFNCRTCQQDNGDLAEADQSRNEETSGAESDSGFINAQSVESENNFTNEQSLQPQSNNFVNQNIPESERSFLENQNCKNGDDIDVASGAEPEGIVNFPSSASEPEGNFIHSDDCKNVLNNESNEELCYQFKPFTSPENSGLKTGVKHRKKMDDVAGTSGEAKKSCGKNSTNKYRDGSFTQGKFNALGLDDYENQKERSSDSVISVSEMRQRTESRDSLIYGNFQLVLDKNGEAEKGNTSPEADSDWECGSGLDQVPTRLDKSGSSRKSEDSGSSVP